MSCGWRIGSCLCSSRNKDDPQLFTITPTKQTREDFQTALAARLGHFPPTPDTGFIGRSRDLLALQRLLFPAPVTGKELVEQGFRYAVVRGQGGEGKTALAAEFARWLVRSQQIRRAAFVSVEGMEKNLVESVLDTLGQQLVKPKFATAVDCHGDLAQAEMAITRVLREQSTLLVMDNLESILPPPFLAQETPEALSQEASAELQSLLALCERLLKVGETRLIFTSREALQIGRAHV